MKSYEAHAQTYQRYGGKIENEPRIISRALLPLLLRSPLSRVSQIYRSRENQALSFPRWSLSGNERLPERTTPCGAALTPLLIVFLIFPHVRQGPNYMRLC